ncbi:DUF1304 domain-containing protein [Pseudohoeflea coraliihabitans]|uniref:DUF1304 domain-containing protein n=1 Tax=Pseudohoeflea coraliihabitans TaxID=2860393 RepID=A0ABS6WM39_9HYPH|nr:DUF1304 domain-containing protein [Pseudohoeflea sp. DP4N28-3]MBW3096180.1 DUF1304 domain-containing protein [Pseudohoeflea sp. DP4N28-3]
MSVVSLSLVAIVALIHFYIVWLEMFAWERRGPKVFRTLPAELFSQTKQLAANQGLYNGFLAFGLVWSIIISNPVWQSHVALFFLVCVSLAGIYGAATVSRRIFYVQALPALAGIASLLI